MSGYTPSQEARDALKVFLNATRSETPPAMPDNVAPGMDDDHRRAMAVLYACAPEAPVAPAPLSLVKRPEPAEVKPYQFPQWEGEAKDAETDAPIAAEMDATDDQPPAPASESDSLPRPVADEAVPAAAVMPMSSLLTVRQAVTLRNARAGEEYACDLTLENARDVALIDDGGAGLAFDAERRAFSGVPAVPGDFELKLSGRIDDRPAEIVARLAVIADPRTLWNSLDSDATDPFWKPDEAFEIVAGEGLRMIAASKRGRSHAKIGGFREDHFALAAHGPWHIAAVADGAGSAKLSRLGSRLATETAIAALPALLDQHFGGELDALLEQMTARPELGGELQRRLYETLVTAAFKSVGAIEVEAERLDTPSAALSTTLILVVARQLARGWFVAAFSVGDGGAALIDLDEGAVTPLTAPDSGEYAGQTRFLARSEFAPFEEVVKRFRWATPSRFTAIALMSDGITDPKLPTDNAFADPAIWRDFWRDDLTKQVDFASGEAVIRDQFLGWLDFWSPGNHDDRTLVVLSPTDG